tara:strand:- start:91 stop:528 length:438 start_codon:yes stop_codon:yes gene_type:complete
MAITQTTCTSFKVELFKAEHDFDAPDTFKIALYTSSASLDASTTAYSTANEITNTSGTAYQPGGKSLTVASTFPKSIGTTAIVDFNNVSWTNATFTARGALIYNSSASNKAVAVLDFGSDRSASASTFEIQFPIAGATSAIIRIT